MKIGVLNFFPAFTPPRSGGELRYWNLYSRLARRHDVFLAGPTFPEEPYQEIRHAPRLVERRFPKTSRHVWWHRFFDRFGFRECSALVTLLVGEAHADLSVEARRLLRECDVFVHENCFLFDLAPRPAPGRRFVYNAYNVEGRLAAEMFPRHPVGRWAVHRVRDAERRCARAADLLLVCSEEDAEEFARAYRVDPLKIHVAPNGVDTAALRPPSASRRAAARRSLALPDGRPAAVFFGSFHPPNLEAAEWIAGSLAPALPGVDFLIAGKACEALAARPAAAPPPPNLRLLGVVDDATRETLLHGADFALNPMFSGSGTNLKMLDYLAAGLPVLTTPRGARGLALEPDRHAAIAPPEDFPAALAALAADSPRRAALAREGRAHAERSFSWDAIAQNVEELLERKAQRRVLLINDFPVTPATSGGQARLYQTGRRLAEAGHGVTILTLSTDSAARRLRLGPRLEEINVPRSRLSRALDLWLLHRLGGVSADDISAWVAGRLTRRFGATLRRESRLARAAVFCHCYMISARRRLPRGTPLVYEAYNVETALKEDLFQGPGWLPRLLRAATARMERAALRHAEFTSCVSEEDAREFRRRFPGAAAGFITAPSGVDARATCALAPAERLRLRRAIGFGDEPAAVFLGSGHPPNRDAARFLFENVCPALPEVTFLLIGSVCGWFVSYPLPSNVIPFGVVEEEQKNFLLQLCDVAVNPMAAGSGASLKIPDYLAAGLPVVSTPIGARGGFAETAEAVVTCELGAFAATLRELLGDPARLERLGRRAREAALDHYDWTVTLEPLVQRLGALTGGEPPHGPDANSSPSPQRNSRNVPR